MQGSDQKQRKLMVLLGILLAAAIVIGLAAMFVNRSNVGPSLDRLSAVQQEIIRINDLAEDFGPDLLLNQTRANVGTLTAGDLALLEPERTRAGGKKNLSKDQLAQESVADAEGTLESAARRNDLTRAYVELIRAELEKEHTLIETARSQTKQDQLLRILDIVDEHVNSLLEQLDKL